MKRLRIEGAFTELPPFLFLQGRRINITLKEDGCVYPEDAEDLPFGQLAGMLGMMLGVPVYEMQGTPQAYAGDTDEAENETKRLMAEFDKFEEELRQAKEKLAEPKLEMNLSDPNLESLTPLGVPIWNSIFTKRVPVLNLADWMNTSESDSYVYIPNDCSKSIQDCEESTSNGMYTQVMVNAYRKLCKKVGINPSVRLAEGTVMKALDIRPKHGAQHTVIGETSSRLANSSLENFDDSAYAREYIACICELEPDEFDKETVRKKVLAKVEYILMGKTSHTYNQRFVHLLYDRLVNQAAIEDAWVDHLVPFSTALMAICRQMIIEGIVLEDNKPMFLARADAMGFAEYREGLSEVFDECCGWKRNG